MVLRPYPPGTFCLIILQPVRPLKFERGFFDLVVIDAKNV